MTTLNPGSVISALKSGVAMIHSKIHPYFSWAPAPAPPRASQQQLLWNLHDLLDVLYDRNFHDLLDGNLLDDLGGYLHDLLDLNLA